MDLYNIASWLDLAFEIAAGVALLAIGARSIRKNSSSGRQWPKTALVLGIMMISLAVGQRIYRQHGMDRTGAIESGKTLWPYSSVAGRFSVNLPCPMPEESTLKINTPAGERPQFRVRCMLDRPMLVVAVSYVDHGLQASHMSPSDVVQLSADAMRKSKEYRSVETKAIEGKSNPMYLISTDVGNPPLKMYFYSQWVGQRQHLLVLASMQEEGKKAETFQAILSSWEVR